jgi:excisionase family DNA binding protein
MTIKDAAKVFDVNPRTVWRWIAEKKFPVQRLSKGTTRIDPSVIEKFLKKCTK